MLQHLLRHRCHQKLMKPTETQPGNVDLWLLLLRVQEYNCYSTRKVPPLEIHVDETEKGNILTCLNSLTTDEMRTMKGIPLLVAVELCKHREEHGPFSTIEDVLEVKRVGTKLLNTICQSLKSGKPDVVPQNYSSNNDYILKMISPNLTTDFLKTVNDVTSLEILSDSICYTSMRRDFHVTHWNHVNFKGAGYQTQTPSQIMEEAYRIVDHLPQSDIYLIERRMIWRPTPKYIQHHLFISRLETAIQTLVNTDFKNSHQHRMFHVKESLTTKTFNLRIGGERVSGQHMMRNIADNNFTDNVRIPSELWKQYHRQRSDLFKERYSNCFLVSLAFCHHLSHRDLRPPVQIESDPDDLTDENSNS